YLPPAPRPHTTPPTLGTGLVIAWCGMRGIVTLATALALPLDFPYRDLILLSAYGVVLGTLVIQGLSLRPLIKRLNLADTGEIEVETQLARQRTAKVALEALAQLHGPIDILRAEHQTLLRQSEGREAAGDDMLLAARRHVLSVQRRALIELRRHGTIGVAALQWVEEDPNSYKFYPERRIARLLAGPAPRDA